MEKSICPICMGELKVIGSRKRKMIDTGGETVRLVVRRLRCMNENCRRIHHELPDVVVPYKMHTAATFEKIIANDFLDTPAEESTIARIRKWFIDRADALVGGLLSIYTAHFQSSGIGPSDLPGSILGRIHFFVEKRITLRKVMGSRTGFLPLREYVLKTEFRFILSTILHTSLTLPSSGIIVSTLKFIRSCNAGILGLKSL